MRAPDNDLKLASTLLLNPCRPVWHIQRYRPAREGLRAELEIYKNISTTPIRPCVSRPTNQVLRTSREAVVLRQVIEEGLDIAVPGRDRTAGDEAVGVLRAAAACPERKSVAADGGGADLVADGLDVAIFAKPADGSVLSPDRPSSSAHQIINSYSPL